MQIQEVMTRNVETVTPDVTIQTAARMMDDLNVGVLPVCDGEKLIGMITDRDITVRATAAGKGPNDCRVGDVMSGDLRYCFEDASVEDATKQMQDMQIRRLPVISHDMKLVGMVSLGDIATDVGREGLVADTLGRVSQPSEPDRS